VSAGNREEVPVNNLNGHPNNPLITNQDLTPEADPRNPGHFPASRLPVLSPADLLAAQHFE